MPQFFATCATSLEYLLVDELKQLGANNVKEGLSLVNFDADWQVVYDIMMWSRVASRVLYPIAKFEAKDEQALYDNVAIIDWSQHLAKNSSFLVHSQSFRSELSHTKFVSQRIKDAIVDHFVEMGEERPDVEFDSPDVAIQCRIRQNQVTISIDFAGIGLHHRGYRLDGGAAPIKENLAAALLIRAGWQKSCGSDQSESLCLYDPMCGSGTFLIEAAMMALDMAPGLFREYLGIFGWHQFNQSLWQQTIDNAKAKREQSTNLKRLKIAGSDINPKAIKSALSNLQRAELVDAVEINVAGMDQLEQFVFSENGLVIVNPPYSERLGEFENVKQLYSELGQLLKTQFSGWTASVLSPNKEFGHAIGIRAKKIYKFNNASIACELLNFDIKQTNYVSRKSVDPTDSSFKERLSNAAMQLCNRLEKNRSKLKKYLAKEGISCYRIYDADLPEYNAAIDVYGDLLHIQEYRAPKSIDEKLAISRIKDLQRVAAGVFKLPFSSVYVKQRRQQKGDWQYETKGRDEYGMEANKEFSVVEEAGRKFQVNLKDYLDTGLFLDHRITRALVADICKGKHLLNLFCYTGSFSVYAATAGATKTTNVDLSNTYLTWAKENFELNQININDHRFVREDGMHWLEEAQHKAEKYDVIILDPPTFSNSKKMENHFEVQRDHEQLIHQCLQLLNNNGILLFSNNFHQFKMQVISSDNCQVTEITRNTTSQDFFRRPLHRCWKIIKTES